MFLGGQWQTRVALPFTGSNGWQSATFSGSWGQADLNALQVRIEWVAAGMVITPASVFALQAVVTYTDAPPAAQESMPPASVFRRW